MASDAAAGTRISDALEGEYNLRIRHPERDEVYRGFAARSMAYRTSAPCALDLRYAEGERCTIDWFPAPSSSLDPPLLVFIHGGYWRALDKRIFSFLAAPYNAAGVAVALIGYELAPVVTLTRIVDDAHTALAWMAHADALRFDRSRVVTSGHSAGGHLAALLGAAPAARRGGMNVVAVVGLSGLFDLEPLLATSVNVDVRMSPEEARRLSPMYAQAFAALRFLAAVGSLETDGFIEQSRRYAARVRALGAHAEFMEVPGRTHFDILEDFAAPDAPLCRATLDLLA